MDGSHEVIAVVLADSAGRWQADQLGEGAQRLVRRADGSVRLEPVESREAFEQATRTSGCFRRGKPIRDPRTREVIGYEMEQVPLLRASGV